MSDSRWREVQRVCEIALATPPDRQRTVLDELCANDAALRAEVETLLAQAPNAGTFLTAPAWEDLDAEGDVCFTAGARLGPYEIAGLIGAGGMGMVYHARDTRLGRSVAIKVLAGVGAIHPMARARFAPGVRDRRRGSDAVDRHRPRGAATARGCRGAVPRQGSGPPLGEHERPGARTRRDCRHRRGWAAPPVRRTPPPKPGRGRDARGRGGPPAWGRTVSSRGPPTATPAGCASRPAPWTAGDSPSGGRGQRALQRTCSWSRRPSSARWRPNWDGRCRARGLSPGSAEVLSSWAWFLAHFGRLSECAAAARDLEALNPLTPSDNLGWCLWLHGEAGLRLRPRRASC